MKRSLLPQRAALLALSVLLTCSLLPALPGASSQAQTRGNKKSRVDIKNFGQVNDHLYRGGQPEGDDYRKLAEMGIKTILDLRGDAEPGAKQEAERAGLRYIQLGLEPKEYPGPDAAKRFIEIVNDEANWPIYTHCAGGRHRTGAMIAAYRMEVDGWDVDQAYDEMKKYGFYTRWGHGCYKDYVFDYSRKLQTTAKAGKKAATSTKPAQEVQQ